jgi:hypothetical protein
MKSTSKNLTIPFLILLSALPTLPSCALVRHLFDDNRRDLASDSDEFSGELSGDLKDARERHQQRIRNTMANGQITLGMGMNQVRSLWGAPSDIETAGDPSQGNQRWTYHNGLSSRYGMSGTKVVYFENGQVAGWQSSRF